MTHIVDLQTMTEIDRQTLQSRFPGTSFPSDPYLTDAILADFGCATFTVDDQPLYSPFFNVYPGPIVQENGVYVMHWIQTALPLDQVKQTLIGNMLTYKTQAQGANITYKSAIFVPNSRLVMMLQRAAANAGMVIRSIDGQYISLTQTDAADFANYVADYFLHLETNDYTHYTAINALASVDDARSYDVSTGWTL